MNITAIIMKKIGGWRDRRDVNRHERIMGVIEQEREPQIKLEKKVLLELRGTLLGGMASSTAYMAFKRDYYDKLASISEQENVKNILLQILKSSDYKLSDKIVTAYVCADIVVLDAIPEIEKLVQFAKKGSIDEKMFNRYLEALKIGKSITDVIYDKLRQSGEL